MQDTYLGTGNLEVGAGDQVEVRYSGWLFDPATAKCTKEFDSNLTRDKGFKFKVGKGKVIQGWDKGMIGMRKGGKRVMCIPSNLGYGATGSGDLIPANTSLIFVVELKKHKSNVRDERSSKA